MQTDTMIRTHPQQGHEDPALAAAINTCFTCAQACTACADACLAENSRAELLRCIRLNLDCADVCEAAGHVLSRQTETDFQLVQDVLRLCIQACGLCADECARHAQHMDHCRVCEEACRVCKEACETLAAGLAH